MRVALVGFLLALGAGCSGSEDSGTKATGDAGSSDATLSDGAADAATPDGSDSDAAADSGAPKVLLPRSSILATELAVLVNKDDPQSVAVADAYVKARNIPTANVVELSFASAANMTEASFGPLKALVDAALGPEIQALAITWTQPYRVDCMSVTSAFALGFDKKYCNQTGGSCGPTAAVPSFNSSSLTPFTDHGIRPSMMLAGSSADEAKKLIARGVAADDTFPAGNGFFVRTTDKARSVRWPTFAPTIAQWQHAGGLKLTSVDNSAGGGKNYIENEKDVLFYFTGLADVPAIETNSYRPGAIADHLTSFGGRVPTSSQMSIVKWLDAGATASYGTVVEPCNYTGKFPNVQVLLPHYFRGQTLLEAYWKSVAQPGEGLFVGEPLAKPWGATDVSFIAGTLSIVTTWLLPGAFYAIESAPTESGPFSPVQSVQVTQYERTIITVPNATAAVYRLAAQ